MVLRKTMMVLRKTTMVLLKETLVLREVTLVSRVNRWCADQETVFFRENIDLFPAHRRLTSYTSVTSLNTRVSLSSTIVVFRSTIVVFRAFPQHFA